MKIPNKKCRIIVAGITILAITAVSSSVIAEPTTQSSTDYVKFQERMSMDWDANDAELLAKVAMSEADDKSTEVKALVIMTVLNRMLDSKFPATISDVIYDTDHPIIKDMSNFDNLKPNEDCYKAIDMIYNGYDNSLGAVYFDNDDNNIRFYN